MGEIIKLHLDMHPLADSPHTGCHRASGGDHAVKIIIFRVPAASIQILRGMVADLAVSAHQER